MQNKLQEKFDQVGNSTRTQLNNMRQVWERVSSQDHDQAPSQLMSGRSSPELEQRVQKVSERISENINIIANEPSLAFYRIQEHVRKTLPHLLEKKHEVQTLHKKVQGSCFDTEYAVNALNVMNGSIVHFQNVQELIKNAMFMKQQIQYEEARRQQSRPSMYQRGGTSSGGGATMMRTQTLDDAALGQQQRQQLPQQQLRGREAETSQEEFSHSMQLPTATSLSIIQDTQRTRAASFNATESPVKK